MIPSQFRWFNLDRRARAEFDAEDAARAVRMERYRRYAEHYRQQSAFEDALGQFNTERPTRVVLDDYLDAVSA